LLQRVHLNVAEFNDPVVNGSKDLLEALRALDDAKIHPLDIGLRRPSLDDVFLSLTGHVAEEISAEPATPKKGRKK